MNHIYFENPSSYPGQEESPKRVFSEGTSPALLRQFMDYLDRNRGRIKSVTLCLYLYNNPKLDLFLKQLAQQGIDVTVISIPLAGYDNQGTSDVYDLDTMRPTAYRQTKMDYARCIYQQAKQGNYRNFHLCIFPHVYVRSTRMRSFSRGEYPYSLHIKMAYIAFQDKPGTICMSSSNFALRDEVKDDFLLFVEDDRGLCQCTEQFLERMKQYAPRIYHFDENGDHLHFRIRKEPPVATRDLYYLAPFYDNAQAMAERRLCELIRGARERIYICAQHICAYNYRVPMQFSSTPMEPVHPGFLADVIAKAKEGLKVSCLSQTFVDAAGNTLPGCRAPLNTQAFQEFITKINESENAAYDINSSVHSKFLVVDDTVVLTTCNFTPTQFIYLDKVELPAIPYSGIHSEVGMFLFLQDADLARKLIANFQDIHSRRDTIHYKAAGTVLCPICNSPMVKRRRKSDGAQFWGCSKYPQCRGTRRIENGA